MNNKSLITILIILFFAFLFQLMPHIVYANTDEIVCERRADGVHIMVGIRFWQNNWPGGDASLKAQVDNNYCQDLKNRFNGFEVSGVPVFFDFDCDLAPGGTAAYPLVTNSWEEIKNNNIKCERNTGGKYACINVQPKGLKIDGMSTDGCISSDHAWHYAKDTTWVANGYINGKYNTAPGRTADNNTLSHEMGHVLYLGEEYGTGWTNPTMMGSSGTPSPTVQKHIDVIVKLACDGDNMVCSTNPDPRGKCCVDRNKRLPYFTSVSFDVDIEESGQCPQNELHLCPYEKCPGTSICNAENKCEGNTCAGTCGSTDCASLSPAQIPASGTCVDAVNKYCCQVPTVTPPPPTRPHAPPAPPPTHCEGVGCLACFNDGSCTLCNLLDVAFEIAKFILAIIGAVVLLFIIYGSFMILLAAGVGEKIEQGKRILVNSVIGLIIAFSAYLMVTLTVFLITGQTQVFTSSLQCVATSGPSSPTGRPPGPPPSTPTEKCNMANASTAFPSIASPTSIECVASQAACTSAGGSFRHDPGADLCITDPAKTYCCVK